MAEDLNLFQTTYEGNRAKAKDANNVIDKPYFKIPLQQVGEDELPFCGWWLLSQQSFRCIFGFRRYFEQYFGFTPKFGAALQFWEP